MRCLYREKWYECGDYLEANIFPVYKRPLSRRKKSKPTKEVQKKLNQIYAENKLMRICHANFTSDDFKVELTYRPEFLPKDDESAARELYNFFRRLKDYRKRHGLPELKYVAVTEKGKRNGRYHHHIIINGGFDPKDLYAIWGRGYVTPVNLQFNENGISDLVRYMLKRPVVSGKRWNSSKNLIHPQAKQRDGRLSKRKVHELARDTDNAREFEKYYPEYYFSEARTVMNDVNGGVYIYARFYRKEAKFNCVTDRQRK